MRKVSLASIVLLSMMLAGCTAENAREAAVKLCGYKPGLDAVIEIASLLYPGIGAAYKAAQVDKIATIICDNVKKEKATKSFAPASSFVARFQDANGVTRTVRLNGEFVR